MLHTTCGTLHSLALSSAGRPRSGKLVKNVMHGRSALTGSFDKQGGAGILSPPCSQHKHIVRSHSIADVAFLHAWQAHEAPIRTARFLHNGEYMLSSDDAGIVKYWKRHLDSVKVRVICSSTMAVHMLHAYQKGKRCA